MAKENLKLNDFKLLKKFYRYIKPYKKWIIFSVLAIPFSTVAALLLPWLLVKIIDDHLMSGDINGLFYLISVFAAAVVMGYLADSVYTYALQKAGLMGIYDLRKDLFEHSLLLSRSYFDKTPIGITLTRLTSDLEALGESLATGVLSLFTDTIKAVALLVLLFYLSWELTLVVLILFPPVYIITKKLQQKLRKYFNMSRSAWAESTAYLQECLNGMKTIQLYAAEEQTYKQICLRNGNFYRAQIKANFYDAILYSVIDGATSVAVGITLWYGTRQILSEAITVGILVGFINTLYKIFIPVREFTQHISVIQRALSALEHVNELFEQPEEDEKSTFCNFEHNDLTNFQSIVFEDVFFKYKQEEEPWILKGVSFTIKKGDRLAIVGATGSGKC